MIKGERLNATESVMTMPSMKKHVPNVSIMQSRTNVSDFEKFWAEVVERKWQTSYENTKLVFNMRSENTRSTMEGEVGQSGTSLRGLETRAFSMACAS